MFGKRKKETDEERWSRIEEEQAAASSLVARQYSSMYSQVYMNTDGQMYYEADDGKKFRMIDEDDEVVKTIKEATKLEKAQIKDRALLI